VTDDRDGQVYRTIQIGTQCWMSQNLNIGVRINGSGNQTNNSIIEKYCQGNDENNCNTYGGLYQWDEAMQYSSSLGMKGICLSSWHLPMDEEWALLTTYLGGLNVAGGKMKEIGFTHWASPNTGATNSSGFTALPGGYRGLTGNFGQFTKYALFWSSSLFDSYNAWDRALSFDNESVSPDYGNTYGFSIRCVKD
jgi:uncharacterized protein (TIGR02145 family)